MRAESQSQQGEAGESLNRSLSTQTIFQSLLSPSHSLQFIYNLFPIVSSIFALLNMNNNFDKEVDQNNSTSIFNRIPSSISLDTPSERSASAEPSPNGHNRRGDLKLLNNGNLSTKSRTPSTILTITNEEECEQPPPTSNRNLSKLIIPEPLDSICWYLLLLYFTLKKSNL